MLIQPAVADRVALPVLVSANLATLLTFIIPGIDAAIASNFPDDALFYNLIARGLLSGLGSTSDGIAQSNGYHPLWAGVVTLAEALPGRSLLWEIVFIFLVNAASSCVLYMWLRALAGRGTAFLLALLATFERTVFRITWSGMETGLAWLMLLVVLLLLTRYELGSSSRRLRFGLSMSLALLFFSRLDGGLFWVALALAYLARSPWGVRAIVERARTLVSLFLPATCLAAVYLLANSWWFDTAMPISGRIKAIPMHLLFRGPDYWEGAWFRLQRLFSVDVVSRLERVAGQELGVAPSAIIVALLAVLLVAGLFAFTRYKDEIALRALIVYTLLHASYYSLLQSDPYSLTWARGPEVLLFLLLIALVLPAAYRSIRRPALRVVAATVSLTAVFALGALTQARQLTPDVRINDFSVARADFEEAVRFIRTRVDPDEPIISWNIGFLGYYTGRRVVSYDGLLNSRAYFVDFKSVATVPLYMQQNRIAHIANRIPREGDPARLLAAQFPGMEASDLEVLGVFEAAASSAGVLHRYAVARYLPALGNERSWPSASS